MRALITRLSRDARGATIVEFAIVAPVMLLLIMGMGDLTYQGYAQSILDGALQKAGRDSTLQGNDTKTDAIDSKVISMVSTIMRDPTQNCADTSLASTWCSERKSYTKFDDIAAERFKDDNNNGIYDKDTECFTDVNGNKKWDIDPGKKGQGGANDVALYTMSITYPRIFPAYRLIGWGQTATIEATTILKNQPYTVQSAFAPTQICPK